jgi:ribosomal protein S15P/S13E
MAKEEDAKKPAKPKKLGKTEIKEKIVELAKKGATAEKIGLELKKLGIKKTDYPKKISQILRDEKLYNDPELQNVQKKLEKIKKHFETNKQDKRAKRESSRYHSKLRKIKLYLQRKGNSE